MKKSLVTIALAVGFSLSAMHAAKADTMFKRRVGAADAPSNSLNITDEPGQCNNKDGWRRAFVVIADGDVMEGCWKWGSGDLVHVVMLHAPDGSRFDPPLQKMYPQSTGWISTDYGQRVLNRAKPSAASL